jgi:hypothetical protein
MRNVSAIADPSMLSTWLIRQSRRLAIDGRGYNFMCSPFDHFSDEDTISLDGEALRRIMRARTL